MIESGPTIRLVERDQAIRVAEMLLAKLNVGKPQVRDLQKMPVERIMSAYFAVVKDMAGQDQMTQGFSPTVDGNAVPQASVPSGCVAHFSRCAADAGLTRAPK